MKSHERKINQNRWMNWNNPKSNLKISSSYQDVFVLKKVEIVKRWNIVTKRANGRTLDIGCNDGAYIIEIAKRIKLPNDLKHWGIDCSHTLIQRARDYARKDDVQNIHFEFGFGEELTNNPNSFDTVLMTSVLEHVLFPYLVLKEAHRVVKPPGKLIISVPKEEMLSKLHLRQYYHDGLLLQCRYFFKEVNFLNDETERYFIVEAKNKVLTPPN